MADYRRSTTIFIAAFRPDIVVASWQDFQEHVFIFYELCLSVKKKLASELQHISLS